MKTINEYINKQSINEGLKDSFTNFFKNIFKHGEVSTQKIVTIDVDPKVFGKFLRDKEYFSNKNAKYPKLVPELWSDDFWELYNYELGEDKYGNGTTVITYIGHADFKEDNHKFEINKDYQEFVEKILAKYK